MKARVIPKTKYGLYSGGMHVISGIEDLLKKSPPVGSKYVFVKPYYTMRNWGERKMSARAKDVQIDTESMTITVPVGKTPAMILVDPKQGKAKIVPLVEHGETVVKSSQGKISKVDYRESELF